MYSLSINLKNYIDNIKKQTSRSYAKFAENSIFNLSPIKHVQHDQLHLTTLHEPLRKDLGVQQ